MTVNKILIGAMAAMLALSALAVLSGCWEKAERQALRAGRPAPRFELRDLDGNLWRLAELRGSAVLVNFWATWCPPCKEEMPSLQRLMEKTVGDPDITIVTVVFRDDPAAALAYVREKGYTFPVLKDPDGSAAEAYGLTGVPETFFIDKKGVLRKKVIGPIGFDSEAVVTYLEGLARE